MLSLETNCLKKPLCLPCLEHKTNDLGAEQYQLSYGPTEASSDDCQKTETRMIQAYHVPRQSLQNHPSGHLGVVGDDVVGREKARWTTSKSGRPWPRQNCSRWPPAVNAGRGSLLNRPSCSSHPTPRRHNWSKDWTELKEAEKQYDIHLTMSRKLKIAEKRYDINLTMACELKIAEKRYEILNLIHSYV